MFRYLSLIVKNSLRNRRRSILTICSIAVSLCILGVLMAMYHAMFFGEATKAQALRLVCRNRVSLTQPIPIYFREQIQRIPGVRDAMVWQWFGGVYKDSRDPKNMFPRFGAEPDHLFNVNSEFQIPEDQKLAFQRERTGCVISRALADSFGAMLTRDEAKVVAEKMATENKAAATDANVAPAAEEKTE